MCVIMPALWLKKNSVEGRYIFLVNLVNLHVPQYFFSVAKEFLTTGTRVVFPVLLRLLFFSTSHSSTCSISSVLSMYIFWQIAHLKFSASLSLVSDSISNRLSILPMFASSRSSYSASSAPTPTPRAFFRPCMEMFFLMM